MDDLIDYLAAYLIGAVPAGFLLLKYFKGIDLRKKGSSLYGWAQAWKKAGMAWGLFALILDIVKGSAAVTIAHTLSPADPPDMVMAGLLVILGDEFPVFFKFKGDRGIGVSLGVFGALLFWMLVK